MAAMRDIQKPSWYLPPRSVWGLPPHSPGLQPYWGITDLVSEFKRVKSGPPLLIPTAWAPHESKEFIILKKYHKEN
jgi:hypothetical protein